MNFKDIKARIISSTTTAVKDSDLWKVTVEMTEKVSFDGKNFDEKKIDAMALDDDYVQAYLVAVRSVGSEYNKRTEGLGTLFKEYLNGDTETVLSALHQPDNNKAVGG